MPLHGYTFEQTPLWAGVYLLPLTLGVLVAGPVSGYLSDRFGARAFATGGLLIQAASFLGLMLIPANFSYPMFAILLAVNGIGSGLMVPTTSDQSRDALHRVSATPLTVHTPVVAIQSDVQQAVARAQAVARVPGVHCDRAPVVV